MKSCIRHFNPNSVKWRENLSSYTVNYDINFQICVWKRIRKVLVYINSSSWTRMLIKWSYFGFSYDLLYIWFKGKFSITCISSLVNVMHLQRVNLIFKGKNSERFCYHFTWVPFSQMWTVIGYKSCYIWPITKPWLIKINKHYYLLM